MVKSSSLYDLTWTTSYHSLNLYSFIETPVIFSTPKLLKLGNTPLFSDDSDDSYSSCLSVHKQKLVFFFEKYFFDLTWSVGRQFLFASV